MGDKQRILLVNQAWFGAEFRQLGFEVITAGSTKDYPADYQLFSGDIATLESDLLEKGPLSGIVLFDNSKPILFRGLERLVTPWVFYSVDAHHHSMWHRYIGALANKTFVAQRDFLPDFLNWGGSAEWLPLWFSPPLSSLPVEGERDIDVSFRGTLTQAHHPKREAFLKSIAAEVSLDAAHGPYVDVYSRSKIVLNHCVKHDVNFRVFEGPGCGALLLTPDIANGMADVLKPGVECVVYPRANAQGAVEKIKYYLAHDEERQKIASAGRQRVLREHLAVHRAERIAGEFRKGAPEGVQRGEGGGAESLFRQMSAAALAVCSAKLVDLSNPVRGFLLRVAAEQFLTMLDQGFYPEQCELELLWTIFSLEESARTGEMFALVKKARLIKPEHVVLLLIEVDFLVSQGFHDEARKRAAEVTSSSWDILHHAAETLPKLRSEILTVKS